MKPRMSYVKILKRPTVELSENKIEEKVSSPTRLYMMYERSVYNKFIKEIREMYGMHLLDEFINFYNKEKVEELSCSGKTPDLWELWGNWPNEKRLSLKA